MKKLFICLSFLLLVFPFSTYASTTKEQRDAVIATAEAYYAQGSQLQYDSFKKSLYTTPEDATSKHKTYTVCSGLVFMSYYQALGLRVPDSTDDLLAYARENQGSEHVVFYYKGITNIYKDGVLGVGSKTVTDKEKKIFIDSLMDKTKKHSIRRGDIFVYKGDTGHAMLVKSVDYETGEVVLIEGDGGRYNFTKHQDNYEPDGAIGYKKLEDRLLPEKKELALIRVITNGSTFRERSDKNGNVTYNEVTYDVTESAKTRMQYTNIDIGKIINNVDNQDFATLGQELTYQLRIRNNSNITYKNLNVSETVDPNVEIVDVGGGTIVGNQIVWNVPTIESGKYRTITYTVRVKNDKNLLGTIISSTGKVNGIATSKIETLIGKKLSSTRQKKLIETFDSMKKTTTAKNSRDFINTLYKKALSIDLGISSLKNLDVIGYDASVDEAGKDSLAVRYTSYNSDYRKYLYSNFYGLRIAKDTDAANNVLKASFAWNRYATHELNDRARTITTDMLTTGDVILAYVGRSSKTDEDLGNKGYIFIKDSLYMYKDKNEFEKITGSELRKFLRDLVGENYIILRPSLRTAVGISISTMPSKLVYGQNATDVDLTSGKLLVTFDDGSTKEISMRNEDVVVSGFDNTIGTKVINVEYNGCFTSYNIDVVSKKMTSISIRKTPSMTQYLKGVENLDLTGGKLYVHYDDGSKETVSFKSQKVKVTGFSNKKLGKRTLTVNYEGMQTNYEVEIVDAKIMALSSSILKTIYFRNESLDLTGGVLAVAQKDGSQATVGLDNKNVKVSGFDNSSLGINTITAEYEGEKLEFYVEVVEKKVTGIAVSQNPTKMNYISGGENLDLTGGVITVYYEDGTVDTMSLTNDNVIVSGFNNSVVGTNNLTVQYRDVTTALAVNVVDKKISSIEVSTKPIKTTYIEEKESLDLTGGVITVHYEDGTVDTMSLTNDNVVVSGFDNSKTGLNNVTVEYNGYKSSFEVEIIGGYKSSDSGINMFVVIGIGVVVLIGILFGGLFLYKKRMSKKVAGNI